MNYLKTKQESGRSMVEMLGVLAIIGVLSVGGIAGYTMAMNKYRANEILNGGSMRAMIVSAQLQRNSNATPNIGEFTGDKPAGATFGGPTVSGDKKTFTFTVSDVAPAVCDQMKAVVPDNSQNPVIDCEANPITLTYNNDLGSGTGAGGGTCDATNFRNCATKAECEDNAVGGTWITSAGSNPTSFCAKYVATDGKFYWCSARAACGGIANMVSLTDLGCSTSGSCGVDGISWTSFWVADCVGETCTDSSTCSSGGAYYVGNGNVSSDSRYYAKAYALCK